MADKQIRIPSGAKSGSNFPPIEVFEIGEQGFPGELIIHNGKLYVYGEGGVTLIDGGIIQAAAILANSITADKLTISSMNFTHNIEWTSVDENTVSWTSGTIEFSDGTSTNVNGGNSDNINTTAYIYYDETDILKTTGDPQNAVGENKQLLAVIEESESGGKAVITPVKSTGTTISGSNIVTGKIQSTDTKTYFDLNGNRLIVNDGSTDIILIGKKS